MFVIHSKREVEEDLNRRRLAQIQSVMSAMTDEKTDKNQIINDIEENYNEMIERIWSGKSSDSEEEDDPLKTNPFFSSAKLVPEVAEPTMNDVDRMYQQVQSKPDVDQWTDL